MSALAVLSLIAPAAPTAPQGTAGEDASLFQGLLDGLQGEGAPDVQPASTGFRTSSAHEDDAAPVAESGDTSATVTILTMTPPTAGVTPPSTSVEEQGEGATIDAADAADRLEQAPFVASPAIPLAPTSVAPVPAVVTQSAAPPVMPGILPVAEGAGDSAVPPLPAAAADDAAAQAGSSASLLAAPAPLKPLSERAAKPLDAAARSAGSSLTGVQAAAYAPADPVKAAASVTDAVQAVDAGGQAPGSATTPVESAAAAVADAALPDDGEGAARPAPLESTAATQAAAGPREAALSTLSRTTIDATAQIAAQILRKLEGRSTRFEMSLTPDELGRVDVKLDIDAQGRLAARLAFDNPAAAADLRGRVDELRRQLQDAGFHLADDAFEFADRDSGSSAFDRGQGGDGRQNRAFSAASRLNAETDIAQPPRWMALSLTPAGVDLKV